jgi:hypothetical protein
MARVEDELCAYVDGRSDRNVIDVLAYGPKQLLGRRGPLRAHRSFDCAFGNSTAATFLLLDLLVEVVVCRQLA